MPTILRVNGDRIGFFSADGDEPPHGHVSKAGDACKFWIDPLQLAHNAGFTRPELWKAWNAYFE